MNSDELNELIDGYILESLDREQTTALNRHLAASREARVEFLVRLRIHADLAKVFSDVDEYSYKPIDPVKTETQSDSNRILSWQFVAAAIVVCSLTALAFKMRADDDWPRQGVATLVASIDADWGEASAPENRTLPNGSYKLDSGTIDLLFADGARVSLSGPADFRLVDPRHIHLTSGNLVAHIPEQALGFIVTSPESEVVDLGTEFGLSVTESGQTDVHVLDGLVEVLYRVEDSGSSGFLIAEGQARRFYTSPDKTPAEIELHTRSTLVGNPVFENMGVEMLSGTVRITDQLSEVNLATYPTNGNWIDLIAEQQDVATRSPTEVTLSSPGSYRYFGVSGQTLPAGLRVNSFLLHFRPDSKEQVRGIVRFDQPILGVICSGKHLNKSDAVFGVSSVHYPKGIYPRGLEPPYGPVGKVKPDPDWDSDEVILSQDLRTLCINAYGNPENGYDQVRVLTLAN